jgi:hypothetical protein
MTKSGETTSPPATTTQSTTPMPATTTEFLPVINLPGQKYNAPASNETVVSLCNGSDCEVDPTGLLHLPKNTLHNTQKLTFFGCSGLIVALVLAGICICFCLLLLAVCFLSPQRKRRGGGGGGVGGRRRRQRKRPAEFQSRTNGAEWATAVSGRQDDDFIVDM